VLSNHDVVRHVTRYGQLTAGEPADLDVGTRRARAALLLMLALPGGAYLYQGEELGLEQVVDLPDAVLQDPRWTASGHKVRGRDGCRVPLPWRGERPPFGFGPDNSRPWLPQPDGWWARTPEREVADPDSMLNLYRTALRTRRDHPALGDGQMTWVDSPDDVLVFHREPGLVCAANLSDVPVPLPDHERVLLASEPLHNGKLPADAAVWLQL
jgi:alpha-glucosidase